MKNKLSISIIMLCFFCLSMFSVNRLEARSTAKWLAEAAIEIGKAIDESCNRKRPEEGFWACKAKTCAPAKCISFRSRCDDKKNCS